jgi:hypothetical protein
MKKTAYLILFFATTIALAQSSEKEAVKATCLNYIEGFYDGDTLKLTKALAPSLNKFGFWKNEGSDNYEEVNYMSYKQAKTFA